MSSVMEVGECCDSDRCVCETSECGGSVDCGASETGSGVSERSNACGCDQWSCDQCFPDESEWASTEDMFPNGHSEEVEALNSRSGSFLSDFTLDLGDYGTSDYHFDMQCESPTSAEYDIGQYGGRLCESPISFLEWEGVDDSPGDLGLDGLGGVTGYLGESRECLGEFRASGYLQDHDRVKSEHELDVTPWFMRKMIRRLSRALNLD
ncbi:hypothetical protein FA13DRAFT_1800248 [Coprinellus micaceus]|uniref:Uncharacterized protein n=1 Tax=Coprinellus micaceus TaxID=71717 RepID=A0A4Y7SH05_COPMI|nr:hypothetical protein FA13DRAFT_1800248 [Coprinellus micaceus]